MSSANDCSFFKAGAVSHIFQLIILIPPDACAWKYKIKIASWKER